MEETIKIKDLEIGKRYQVKIYYQNDVTTGIFIGYAKGMPGLLRSKNVKSYEKGNYVRIEVDANHESLVPYYKNHDPEFLTILEV